MNSLFKTPTKCTSLSLLLCINRPLHIFRFYVKPSSGGTKTTFIPHPMLLMPLYLCSIFVCKLHSLSKSEYKTYIKTQSIKSLKIRKNSCRNSTMQQCGSLCYLYTSGFFSWLCIFDGHLVIMSCCFLSSVSHAAVCTKKINYEV
jgi:hypothetical protein